MQRADGAASPDCNWRASGRVVKLSAMTAQAPGSAVISLSALVDAFEFVSVSELEEHQAYICRKTGRIFFTAESLELEEEDLPEDLADSDQYEPVPYRRELNLGSRLALAFVQQELPGALPKAREIFSRKGAYARFKRLLHETGALDSWYAFEQRAVEAALRAWCDDVGIPLSD